FCNFVVGNHEYILLSYFISNRKSPIKVQKISQITNFLENFLIPNWRINNYCSQVLKTTQADNLKPIIKAFSDKQGICSARIRALQKV
ncbi:MAG: hypothetical protein IJ604_12310, partial [Prevotella sp.]|nr:hypothetical protein [Prevotella sp.]